MELLFRAFPLGDVDHRGQHKESFVGLKGVETDLHWSFTAVLAASVQITARSHGATPWIQEEIGAVAGMLGSEALGHQQLDWLAQQLVTRVAEEALSLVVDQHDLSPAVHHDHAARCRFYRRAEPGLRLFACSDVDDRGENERARVPLDGIEPDLHGDLSTVFAQAEQFPARAHLSDLWIGKKAAPKPDRKSTR